MAPNVQRLFDETTVGIVEAGSLIGLKRDAAYQAAAEGRVPTIRVSRKIVVPTAWLRTQLGLTPQNAPPQQAA